MSKTFSYTKITGHYYCQYSDEWEQDGVDFDFTVDDSQLLDAVVDMLYNEYFFKESFAARESLKQMIEEQDLLETLVDGYEDKLKEHFEQDALDAFEDYVKNI